MRELRRGMPPASPANSLLLINKVTTAILLPASLIALCAERFLLAVADRLNPARIDSQGSQRVLHRAGTLVAQCQVVIGRSAFVAVSLDREVDIRVLTQELRIRLKRRLLIRTNVGLVIIEIHILDVLREQVLIRDCRSRRRWWWRRLGHR